MRRIVLGLAAAVAIAVVGGVGSEGRTVVSAAQPQPSCQPLQLNDIEEYVKVKAPVAVVRRRVTDCGLGFGFDRAAEDRLKALGAEAELITLLTNVGRAGLEIRSTPAGAVVTVDGQRRGNTPITISDLAPGAHKVLVSQEGYLDNSSDVTLKAGDTSRIERTLTRVPAQSTAAPAAAPPKGGGSKLPLILAGVGGAGAAAALALRGGGSDPPPPPAACSFSISPTSASVPAAGGTQNVTITVSPAGCSGPNWTASSGSAFLTLSATSGSGSGSVTVTVAANTATASRAGTATIAGQTFSVTQEAAAPPVTTCTATAIFPGGDGDPPNSPTTSVPGDCEGAGCGERVVQVTINPNVCQWTIAGQDWFQVFSGNTTQTGSGTVRMRVTQRNGTGRPREVQIRVTGSTLTSSPTLRVTQCTARCPS